MPLRLVQIGETAKKQRIQPTKSSPEGFRTVLLEREPDAAIWQGAPKPIGGQPERSSRIVNSEGSTADPYTMAHPLHFGRAQGKESLAFVGAAGLASLTWLAASLDPSGLAACSLVLLAFALRYRILREGVACLLVRERWAESTVPAIAAMTAAGIGATAVIIDGTGLASDEVLDHRAGGLFLATAATILAIPRVAIELSPDERGPRQSICIRVVLGVTMLLLVAQATSNANTLHGVAAALTVLVATIAAAAPETWEAARHRALRRLRRSVPEAVARLDLDAVVGVDTVVIEPTAVLTEGRCEFRRAICIDGGDDPEEVVYYAAVAEYLLPPHRIRTAVLNAAKAGLRTVPTVKHVEYSPGRGASAQFLGQDLVVGNRGLLIARGVAAADVARAVAMTKEGRERGETVIFVALGGVIRGAICLYDPPTADGERLLSLLERHDLKIAVWSGGNEDTVRAVLGSHRVLEIWASMTPKGQETALAKLRQSGGEYALVARAGSPLLLAGSKRARISFSVDPETSEITVIDPHGAQAPLGQTGLEHIAPLLATAHRRSSAHRATLALVAAYHLLTPLALNALVGLTPLWVVAILGATAGSLLPRLVLPSGAKLAAPGGASSEKPQMSAVPALPPNSGESREGSSSDESPAENENTSDTGLRLVVTTERDA